jgi:hypothetical protein
MYGEYVCSGLYGEELNIEDIARSGLWKETAGMGIDSAGSHVLSLLRMIECTIECLRPIETQERRSMHTICNRDDDDIRDLERLIPQVEKRKINHAFPFS